MHVAQSELVRGFQAHMLVLQVQGKSQSGIGTVERPVAVGAAAISFKDICSAGVRLPVKICSGDKSATPYARIDVSACLREDGERFPQINLIACEQGNLKVIHLIGFYPADGGMDVLHVIKHSSFSFVGQSAFQFNGAWKTVLDECADFKAVFLLNCGGLCESYSGCNWLQLRNSIVGNSLAGR